MDFLPRKGCLGFCKPEEDWEEKLCLDLGAKLDLLNLCLAGGKDKPKLLDDLLLEENLANLLKEEVEDLALDK